MHVQSTLPPIARARAPRLTCRVLGPAGPLDAVVEDATAEGLFVPTGRPLPAGAPLVVRLGGDEHAGVVAWSGRGPLAAAPVPGFAVRFTPPLPRAPLPEPTRRRADAAPLVLVSEAEVEEAGYAVAAEPLGDEMQAAVGRVMRVSTRRLLLRDFRAAQLTQRLLLFPSVEPALVATVLEARLLGVLVIGLLEELAEPGRDRRRFEALATRLMGMGAPGPVGDALVDGAFELWRRLWQRLVGLPRFAEAAPILRHDWLEVLGAMRFARLAAERPELGTAAMLATSEAQRLLVGVGATVDWMASPSLPSRELAGQRRAAARCQRLAWLGATLTGWRRELEAGRRRGALLALAREERVLSADDLAAASAETVAWLVHASGLERRLLLEWEQERAALAGLDGDGAGGRAHALAQRMQSLLVVQLARAGAAGEK